MGPRRDIDHLKSEMEELFADLCQVPRLVASRRGFRPPVDVYRTEDPPAIVVVAELAGVDPTEIELAVGDGVLSISGTREREIHPRFVQQLEIEYGAFQRRVALAEPVDAVGAEATYAHGLLTVVLPVSRRSRGRVKVPVSRGVA